MSKFVQKISKDFLIIFALIMLMITFLRQIYDPSLDFDLKSIYTIMSFSLISALMGFISYSPHDVSETNMRIRVALHFLTLEILLIALGIIFNIVNTAVEGIILALQIAVIYILVRLLSWQKDKKEAFIINERLKELKKDL